MPSRDPWIRTGLRGINPMDYDAAMTTLRNIHIFSYRALCAGAVGIVLCWSGHLHAEFECGTGMEIVTPDPLLPISGGIGPSNPAWQKKGELTVRALVLKNESTSVVFVTGDFLGFPAVLGNKVRAMVQGIPPENILISASHTHSAPDMYGFPDGAGGFAIDLRYAEIVMKKMAIAIEKAQKSSRPARLKVSHQPIAERIAFNYYAPDLYDRRCSVLQTIDSEGLPIATLVNYAIHPEVLGPRSGYVSADLIWPMTEYIESRAGGLALFVNGALGGMVTADVRDPASDKPIQTWDECTRIGELLASESLRILLDAPILHNPTIQCFHKDVTFPVESEGMQQIMKYSPLQYAPDGDTSQVTTRLNYIHLGPARILTIPGEALPNIGFYLKRKMPTAFPFLFGLTNDAFGYILSETDFLSFDRYSYITRTSLGEKTATLYIESVQEWFR
ncbi:MAG: hypothetical protein LR011_11050 [Verrucomicrobia bacterium]|nr:hypothetical protein [Verrucomicrobiota bacterium]